MIYCCKRLDRAIKDGKIRHDGKQWHTVSSSVFMLTDIKFCIWCGKKLPKVPIIPENETTLFKDVK